MSWLWSLVFAPPCALAGWLTTEEWLRERRARRSLREEERVEMQHWIDQISSDD